MKSTFDKVSRPSIRANNRNTDYTIFPGSSEGSLKWKSSSDSGMYGQVIIGDDGTLFLTKTKGLVVINPDSTKKWKLETPESHAISVPTLDKKANPICTACNGGIIYTVANKGFLAINPERKELWKIDTFGASPIVDGQGYVFLMDKKGILYSYDLHGNKLWTWDLLKPDDDFSILSLNGLSIGIHSTLYVSFGSVLYH